MSTVTNSSLGSPRSVTQDEDGGDDQDSEDGQVSEPPVPVIPVDPDSCVLPDTSLHAFTILDDALVTLALGPTQWKMQLFERPSPGEDPRPGGQIGEVELSTCTPPAESQGESAAPRFLPVLCCASPPGSRTPLGHSWSSGGVTLEGALFGLLFGADAALLESPVVLCGLPDGQLCCVIVKTLVTSTSAPGDPKALVKILHHLEEPVVFIGALRTEPLAEDVEDVHCDCLVALGHHGRTLAIKASWDEAGHLVPELREYSVPGPVLCAACDRSSRVYHSTSAGLRVVDLAQEGSPLDPTEHDGAPGSLPALLYPDSLGVCSLATLCVSSSAPEGMSHGRKLRTKAVGWVEPPPWRLLPVNWPSSSPCLIPALLKTSPGSSTLRRHGLVVDAGLGVLCEFWGRVCVPLPG